MVIRQARTADLAQIQQCATEAYSKYTQRIGKAPAPMVADFAHQIDRELVWVAECNNCFAGYIVFYPVADAMHLENVAVRNQYAGQGVGRQLIDHAETQARRLSMISIELYTNLKMTENLAYYPKLGYTEIDRRDEDGFSRVYYRKIL
jgi:ribosomal protein S18 acetylase RimI-like enzyme